MNPKQDRRAKDDSRFATVIAKSQTLRSSNSPTDKEVGPSQVTRPERPRPVSITLHDSQVISLDRLSARMREVTRSVVSRSEIIRALIDALFDSAIQVESVRSEEDLRSLLTAKLKQESEAVEAGTSQATLSTPVRAPRKR